MAPSTADRSLLDRLNALKPSGVTLERPSPTGVAPQETSNAEAKPAPSRADALADRLRLLRQDANDQPASAPGEPKAGHVDPDNSDDGDGGDDPLLFSDERALNDFLLDLTAGGYEEEDAPEDGPAERDDGLVLPDVPSTRRLDEDTVSETADDEQQVAQLLESLGRPKEPAGSESQGPGDPDDPDDPDDSDGEVMGREVRRVVEQAQDEAKVAETDGTLEDADNPLGLPAVPTKLVDLPVDLPDAADDIAARLAGLRGLRGPDTGLGQTDAFGLPSAPTFQPGDQRQPRLSVGHGHGRTSYTDEDSRSWCVVCLEDAVVRCLGCDDDPYCARCWREMHVGPAAGFDERGHKRVLLQR